MAQLKAVSVSIKLTLKPGVYEAQYAGNGAAGTVSSVQADLASVFAAATALTAFDGYEAHYTFTGELTETI